MKAQHLDLLESITKLVRVNTDLIGSITKSGHALSITITPVATSLPEASIPTKRKYVRKPTSPRNKDRPGSSPPLITTPFLVACRRKCNRNTITKARYKQIHAWAAQGLAPVQIVKLLRAAGFLHIPTRRVKKVLSYETWRAKL
jgi:hypothetical protein